MVKLYVSNSIWVKFKKDWWDRIVRLCVALFSRKTKLCSRALLRCKGFEVDAAFLFEPPRLVVSLERSVSRVIDRLPVAIIGGESECDHNSIVFRRKFIIRRVMAE